MRVTVNRQNYMIFLPYRGSYVEKKKKTFVTGHVRNIT